MKAQLPECGQLAAVELKQMYVGEGLECARHDAREVCVGHPEEDQVTGLKTRKTETSEKTKRQKTKKGILGQYV